MHIFKGELAFRVTGTFMKKSDVTVISRLAAVVPSIQALESVAAMRHVPFFDG